MDNIKKDVMLCCKTDSFVDRSVQRYKYWTNPRFKCHCYCFRIYTRNCGQIQ